MNPLKLLELKTSFAAFKSNHPKLLLFIKAVSQHGLTEGNVIEVTVKTTDGKEYSSNIKLSASDILLLRNAKEIFEES